METPCQASQKNVSKKQAHGPKISKNNPKFKMGHLVMVKNHPYPTFKPKYLLGYRVLKILDGSTLLLVTLNGNDMKTTINNV